jgi:hypothetical protein
MANIKDLIKSIEAADSSFDEKLAAINQMEETLVAMRQQEEQAVQENVDLIVEAIKVMERKVENQLEIAKSIVPEKGDKGDKGDRGLDGANGQDGKDGRDGINGRDGQDGQDGVSVTDAKIDFDGSLIITLSTGQEINVGEVVAPELQEKIKLVTSGGAGTVLPSQTGNANKYLKTDGTGLSWATVSGGSGTVTSVGGTGTVSGISLSGTVTTSGNLTLGGTLDLSSPPAIGGTTPAAGTFTTLTSPILKSATGSATTGVSLDTPLGAQATIIDIGDGTRPLRLNGGSAGSVTTAGVSSSVGILQLSGSNSDVRTYTGGRGATLQFNVLHTASAVDYVQITGATTASKVVAISAQGSDTDVTLSLSPKGAGTIRFGTYTGTILTPTGYITITDSGGTTRRLLVG